MDAHGGPSTSLDFIIMGNVFDFEKKIFQAGVSYLRSEELEILINVTVIIYLYIHTIYFTPHGAFQ